jgi:hypothetical protein
MPGAVGPSTLLGLALFTACHLGLLAASERPARLRALVAFAFGLIHGFAFAGVLAEMDLPRARLVPALVGFNVGVELGQLANRCRRVGGAPRRRPSCARRPPSRRGGRLGRGVRARTLLARHAAVVVRAAVAA